MLHFLAKIGRKPWAKVIVPATSMLGSTAYLFFHMYGHNLARNILAASSESGQREEISKNLQTLIKQVFNEIKSDFNQPIGIDIFKHIPVIKWFASSTPDPITLGMAETRSGVVIGLPSYYNYENEGDVPDTILEVTRFKLFKSWSKGDDSKEDKDQAPVIDDTEKGDDNVLRIRINKNTPEAKQYIEALVLSEDAKKFSIARELFLVDSYRPLLLCSVMITSGILSVFLARGAVKKMHLTDAHLIYRIPCYIIAGMAGAGNYCFLSDSINTNYSTKADSRAMGVNESYRQGAVEYFTKIIQRNKALRSLMKESASTYDEDGNIKVAPIRRQYVPFTERLEAAKKKKESE